MAVIVIDEDMNRSIANVLRTLGHTLFDVRDHGLRGKSDQQVYEFAQQHKAAIITADLDFSNTIRFPLGAHGGIIVARFPNEFSTKTINQALEQSLRGLSDGDISGALIIISPGKIRIKRPSVS